MDGNQTECSVVNGRIQYDDRYENIGEFSISEYDLQSREGVVQIIEESVAGSASQTESRKNVMLDFYVRPTIPFELECESQGYKKNLVSEISFTTETINSISFASLSASTAGVLTGFVVACISHCCYGCTYNL